MATRRGFYDLEAPRGTFELHGIRLVGPAYFHRMQGFQSLHQASYDAVRAVLPSRSIVPVRWFDGSAVVFVSAVTYEDVTTRYEDGALHIAEPYAEVTVGPLVSEGPARRGTAVLRGGARGFVLHMPVTTKVARDVGRAAFGLPKFVADIDLHEEPDLRRVAVSDGGRDVLRLTVHVRGPALTVRGPIIMYSSLHGRLQRLEMPFLGRRRTGVGSGSGSLTLADHPVSETLRALSVSPRPLATAVMIDGRLLMPPATDAGHAVDYVGHVGDDRVRGRFTVSYPGTGPIDRYAPVRDPLSDPP